MSTPDFASEGDAADAASPQETPESLPEKSWRNFRDSHHSPEWRVNREGEWGSTQESRSSRIINCFKDYITNAIGFWKRSSDLRWLVRSGILIASIFVFSSSVLPRLQTNSRPENSSAITPRTADTLAHTADAISAPIEESLIPRTAGLHERTAVLLAAARVSSNPAAVPDPSSLIPVVSNQPLPAAAGGTLAVSSSTSVDIYKSGEYLGSVSVILELPAGPNTLEYRHGSLRQTETHIISADERTKVTISFEVNVRINSKPWSEVFMDGVEKKDLGQTPLGNVRVQVGSVLRFENPKFEPKKYRVTGNETAIQVEFP